jgi:hypothetical protein
MPPRGLRLETRELLLIAFFAAFLVAARAAMRWHIHVPGHAMIAVSFGLVLVRSCVDRRGAATLCGVFAGAVVAALGMGKGGPLVVLKLALPGLVVDLGTRPRARSAPPISILRGLVLGGVAGASGLVPLVAVEWLADVDPSVIALHALASGLGKSLFGASGGAAGAWVARELDHHGLLRTEALAVDGERS